MERLYWLGFSCFHGIGPIKFKRLLDTFWNAENAWHATEIELKHSGIGAKVSQDFLEFRKSFNLEKYAEELEKNKVFYVLNNEKTYPSLLAQSDNPPFVLYIKGNKNFFTSVQSSKYVGVVGTRKVTNYGKQVTENLTEDLATSGCVIVSGLAIGVDAIAHAAALRSNGRTIAVLGCGVDCCTPRENQKLYDSIIESGSIIVSEAPLGQASFVGSFPSRNRIIAGLSDGVLVTEGAEDSGSLITANDAFKNGRKVFAVPGPINSSVSKGPNALIHKGATMVTTVQNIFDELSIQTTMQRYKKGEIPKGDTEDEQSIIDLLLCENLAFDELVKKTGIASSTLGTTLSFMEIKGIVQTLDTGVFTLAS